MITKKPSIFIYTNDADEDFLREICAGIEEEGVFFEVIPKEERALLSATSSRASTVGEAPTGSF